jgi:outer membrane protein assembly factor BamB
MCCVALLAGEVCAADWPRFRGPNGAGIADDKTIPVKWSEKDIIWKVALPGDGNSSPIIWGDRIFLQSASKDGRERHLLSLNAADGATVWKTMVAGARAHINKKNSWASSTPATDGERVYALFWDGNKVALHGFDFNGNPLWKYPLGSYPSQHGPGASPIVHEGKVFLLNDHDEGAVMVALDVRTGKKVWEARRDHVRACYSTPFLLERSGRPTELIVGTTAGITAYNPDTGKEIWHWKWTFSGMRLRTVASPVVAHGLIVHSSGDGKGDRHAVAIRPGDSGDVPATNLVWEQLKPPVPYVPCYLVHGEHLYWIYDKGFAGCTVAKTGENVWVERLGGEFTASPVLIDGKVYAVNESGDVYVFAAQPRYKLLARNALDEPVLASPAVAHGRLYIRGKTHLFCIGTPVK